MGNAFLHGQSGAGGKIPDPKAGTTLYVWELWEFEASYSEYVKQNWDSADNCYSFYWNKGTPYYNKPVLDSSTGVYTWGDLVGRSYSIDDAVGHYIADSQYPGGVYLTSRLGANASPGSYAATGYAAETSYSPSNFVCSLYSLNNSLTTVGVTLSTTTGEIQTINGNDYYIKYLGAKTY